MFPEKMRSHTTIFIYIHPISDDAVVWIKSGAILCCCYVIAFSKSAALLKVTRKGHPEGKSEEPMKS